MSAPGVNVTSLSSSTTSSPNPNNDRPERSRNAKAQARHRAKRKAYIEQLEQTVTKLQTALGFSPEQVAALPPPLAKIRELESENARLVEENERLKRLMGQDPNVRVGSLERTRSSNSIPTSTGYDVIGRCTGPTNDYGIKRRRLSGEMDGSGVYDPSPTNNNGQSTQGGGNTADLLGRAPPPPLTIPHQQQQQQQQQQQHHQQYTPTHTHTPHSAHPAHGHQQPMFSLHHHQHPGGGFSMPPSTPSSSTTSSPPFSASVVPSY
ncbi:hypothetical protein E1B28_006711 [Marasmius oreades]|uniref:BZIP domain-containing protein n=1 Tax=Marasmius oreades TaxID=181124 RepID=A0A9P8AB57_9AGAR|nr:uncharacterized protein E1B28_006711 [Marasmius oreades]KAG7096030.1 hypothetical protein E1B28_006711 [Marasmius oreades]